MKPIKTPLTVRLDDDLLRIVKRQAERTGASLGSVVADAARRTLMPQYQKQHEAAVLSAVNKCFNRLVKMDEARREEHELIREMLAMQVRSFYNHTPAPPAEGRAEQLASAAKRFDIFLDRLTRNLRDGESMMEQTSKQETLPASGNAPDAR